MRKLMWKVQRLSAGRGERGGQSVMEAEADMYKYKKLKRKHAIKVWPLTLILPVWDHELVAPEGREAEALKKNNETRV